MVFFFFGGGGGGVLSVLKKNSLKIHLTQQANLRIKIDFDEFRVVIPGDEGFVQISL